MPIANVAMAPKVELSDEQGRDLVNQLLGQSQMADAFGKFSRTVRASKMMVVKESRLYKYLKKSNPHGAELDGTWEGFCNSLGISVDQADRDIANLKTFGEEALESMQRVGVGYRDLAQYRKLPDGARAQLIEVAKLGDKEALLDLAETLIERHTKEKAQLGQQVDELRAAKTQSAVERQKTEQENVLLQKRLTAATAARADVTDIVPAHVSDIRLECAALYKKAELSIDGLARLTAEVHLLDGEWALSVARSNFAALQGLIGAARGAAAELHRAYGADLDGDNSTLERLTQKELFKCATEYKDLIATHEHEAALRAHERDVAKPKGKGRPKAAPTLD
jgi:hypothetical protein